ncbi:hypothetical protein P8605_08345 [Streptomyces sp. T-3]|nr:hypothetical protein [Streptomyces sp. T-3]
MQRFAYELRKLRDEADAPAYRTMARRAGYSAATLSQAAAGERLPTLPVLLAYVHACDGNASDWQQRWEQVTEELLRQPRPEQEDADPPYRGLARFEPGDAQLFFGREQLAAQLEEMARRHRVSALVGASGSGKSSLLRAGLVPRLRDPGEQAGEAPAAVRILTPGPHPMAQAARLEPAPGKGDTWVLVDQYEELFTLCADEAERAAFLARLLAALDDDSRLRVILAVRADFFAHCAEDGAQAAALKDATLLVGPMSNDQLRSAIVQPATTQGLIVERDLTTRIIEEVEGEPGALPLMSHALMETWRRRRGRTLTVQAYEAAGGLRGAIARTAEDAYHRLTPAQATVARRILLRLVAPGNGTQDTHRPTPRPEFATHDRTTTGADSDAVLDHLARARLLTVDDGHVLLAHEALLTAWPRLHDWIEEDREHLRIHRRLTHDADAWEELDRDPGALYRGTRLVRAEETFAATERASLTPREAAFLDAGTTAREAERRRAVRATLRSRQFTVALATVCVLALMAGLVAWQQNRSSDRQRTQAAARRIASVAANLRTTDPVRAMRLSVAAWRLADTPETRGAVLAALTQSERDAMLLPAGVDPTESALSADGHTLLHAAEEDPVRRWDVRTRRELPSQPGPPSQMSTPAAARGKNPADFDVWAIDRAPKFGDSGRTMLSMTNDVELWDLRHGRPLFEPDVPEHGTASTAMAVSPDDRYLAVCAGQSHLWVWDVAKNKRVPVPFARAQRPMRCEPDSMDFGADGRSLMTLTAGDRAEMRSLTSGRVLWRIEHTGLKGVELSRDGKLLAARDGDEILVWRTSRTKSPVLRYPILNEDVTSLRIDTDHQVIRYLGGGAVRTISLDRLVHRRAHEELLAAEFNRDGSRLATVRKTAEGKRFELFHTRAGKTSPLPRPAPCTPPSDDLVSCGTSPLLALRPDGRHVVYSEESGGNAHLYLWDTRAHRRIRIPNSLQDTGGWGIYDILYTANGRYLLADVDVEGITVWDTRRRTVRSAKGVAGPLLAAHPDGRSLVVDTGMITTGSLTDRRARGISRRPLTGEETTVAAFSPDGRLLAAGDGTGRVTLWDGQARHRLGQLPATDSGAQGAGPEEVTALAFTRDGKTLATAGDKGTTRLWDTTSSQALGGPLPTAPGDPILALAFTPDGAALHAVGRRSPVRTYTTAPAHAIRTLCRRAKGGLSPAEWRRYLPDTSYRSTC